VLIKVGTLDDPSVYEGPQLVTWTSEMQKFHLLPSDVPAHPEFPRPKGSDSPTAEAPSSDAPKVETPHEHKTVITFILAV
jgi:hypothetical protein